MKGEVEKLHDKQMKRLRKRSKEEIISLEEDFDRIDLLIYPKDFVSSIRWVEEKHKI